MSGADRGSRTTRDRHPACRLSSRKEAEKAVVDPPAMRSITKCGAALLLMLVLARCTGLGASTEPRDAGDGRQTPLQPTGAGWNGDPPHQASDDVHPEPDLYLVDPITGGTEPILSAAGELHQPEASPDGSQLAFHAEAPNGTSQIFVLELENGRTRQLTHVPGGALDPTWSPDGSQIAFAARSRPSEEPCSGTDIFVMDADGGHIQRLAGTARNDGHPDWSPDGSRIVFHSRPQRSSQIARGLIWVVSVHDGELARLTQSHPFWGWYWNAADPAWSPDGRWIAYSRLPGSNAGSVPLWVMRSDGTGERSLHRWKRLSGVCESEASWSPDGNSIAFLDTCNGSVRIGILDVQMRESTQVSSLTNVSDVSWGTEGLIVSMEEGAFEPSISCA
jgi:Tol biopolymer transport system component